MRMKPEPKKLGLCVRSRRKNPPLNLGVAAPPMALCRDRSSDAGADAEHPSPWGFAGRYPTLGEPRYGATSDTGHDSVCGADVN